MGSPKLALDPVGKPQPWRRDQRGKRGAAKIGNGMREDNTQIETAELQNLAAI
jgi:hypothetical protein